MTTRFNSHDRRKRHASPSGFSLVELMVVVTVIGILAAMAVPSYQRAIEQSKADIAGANLRAIWAAERLYWLEYHSFTDKIASQTAPAIGLADMGLIDPMLFTSGNYSYAITAFTDVTFTATATHPTDSGIKFSINESGTVTAEGMTLGFQ